MPDRESTAADVEAIAEAAANFRKFSYELEPKPNLISDMRTDRWLRNLHQLFREYEDGDGTAWLRSRELVAKMRAAPPASRRPNLGRDLQICIEIDRMIERGFHATRNETTDAPCACELVSEALHQVGIELSERRVANIWSENAWRR